MTVEPDNQKFARVVEALRPWLPAVVLAGGWAHRLHRLHPLAEAPRYRPLMTTDVDVAIGSAAPALEADMRARLLAAHFEEEMSGEHQPPITYYQIGTAEHPYYLEFMTPLTGSDHTRDGKADVTIRIGGISAQKLRYLDLLLVDPWSVAIGTANGFPLVEPAAIRVPNPAAYIAQKLLVVGRRRRDDQERDVLYVHDTLQTFAGHLIEVRQSWLTKVAPDLQPRTVKAVKASVRDRFAEVTDLIRGAAHIATSIGRSESPRSILEACQVGLERIFA